MFLRNQNVLLIGIYFIFAVRTVYPRKDNIGILSNYFNNEISTTPSPVKCDEETNCDISHTNARNKVTNKNPIGYLKSLFGKENSGEQKDERIEGIKTQPVDKINNNDEAETKTVITPVSTDAAVYNQEKSKDITTRKSVKAISNSMAMSTENTLTSNEDSMSSTENILSELVPLTAYADGELHTGQTIEVQRSNADAENEIVNEAGVEILKNVSSVCGSLLGKRISFANITTLMEFPWTVLLLYNSKDIYHCGGSLITQKYVLTAAHCVAQEFYELTGVRLGEHDVSKERDCELDIGGDEICSTTVDAKVVKIIIHHGYSRLSFKNDIALLRLEQEYFGRSFYPICIPTPEMTYTNTMAIVAGWGATEKALRSNVLRKAEVPILDMSKCRSIYRYSKFNDTTEICGSGVDEVDVCQGDSGGAIFYEQYIKNKLKHYQLGIISLGVRRCGDKRFLPAVFTKLQGFYKWIENNLEY